MAPVALGAVLSGASVGFSWQPVVYAHYAGVNPTPDALPSSIDVAIRGANPEGLIAPVGLRSQILRGKGKDACN